MIKRAFTLAEVLITLSIIGVISVMVVPSFINNSGSKIAVTTLRAVLADFSDAFQKAVIDEDVSKVSDFDISESDFLQKYFEAVAVCDRATSPCFASSYKNISGGTPSDKIYSNCDASITLINGAAACLKYNYSALGHKVYVDVNGQKSPNVVGEDLFAFYFDDNGKYYPVPESYETLSKSISLCESGYPGSCFSALAKKDWNIDKYLD